MSVLVPLLYTLLSFYIVTGCASSPAVGVGTRTVRSLSSGGAATLRLATTTATTSTTVALVPKSTNAPVTSGLTSLDSCFLVIIYTVCLRGCLIAVAKLTTFGLLVPVKYVLLSLYFKFGGSLNEAVTYGLILFKLTICLMIPMDIEITSLVSTACKTSVRGAVTSTGRTASRVGNRTSARDRRDDNSSANKGDDF